MEYEDILFDDLAEKIFNEPPKTIKSIPISFDFKNTKELHEALLMMFTKAMKKFYSNSEGVVNLLSLNENEFNLIQRYFNSFSIKIHYQIYDIFEMNKVNNIYPSHDRADNNLNLDDHKFKLIVEKSIFIIWFSLIA